MVYTDEHSLLIGGSDYEQEDSVLVDPKVKIRRSNFIPPLTYNILETSDHITTLKSKGFNEFIKRIDFGSPVPANEILLPFQRTKRTSTMTSQKLGVSPKSNNRHLRRPSESCIPNELL